LEILILIALHPVHPERVSRASLLIEMASAHVTTHSILSSFLPRLSGSTSLSSSKFATLYSRQLSLPLLPSLGFALPSAIQLNIPSLVEGIWESILRAVPKKKTSHMKKRHRQYAGKALKDVTALNNCSACGNVKRAHLLCPYCVKGKNCKIYSISSANAKAEVKAMFRKRWSSEKQINQPINWQAVKRDAMKEHRSREEQRVASQEKPVDSTGQGL
jgi:ribosomal protein L32